MSNIAKILGQRMKNRRIELKLSQEKLAEKAGVHPTYIGQLERGEKNVSVDYLLGRTDNPDVNK